MIRRSPRSSCLGAAPSRLLSRYGLFLQSAGSAQVPKSKSLMFVTSPSTTWTKNVTLTLSTDPAPWSTSWSFPVDQNCSAPRRALLVPPNQNAPLTSTSLPAESSATTSCGVIVPVKLVLPVWLCPSWIVNLIEPDVIVYVVDSH